MGWKGLERNKLDYILTDLLPVELSEIFSFRPFYDFLLQKEQQDVLNKLIKIYKTEQAENNKVLFENNWATMPLKYNILKGTNALREMSIVQPLSVINLFLFIECYQKDILNFFATHHCFSLRYHKKCTDLYYKSRSGQVTQYFQNQARRMGKGAVQQIGSYFNIAPYESINSFTDSRKWRLLNFEYRYFAKLDYKSCFDSIYSHVYKWIIERNVIDSKDAKTSNLLITVDRILQNINGRSSNGLLVGPEFSRMIAEILLQYVDSLALPSLLQKKLTRNKDYVVYRYVDDIFIFANSQECVDSIIKVYGEIGANYLLRFNELKLTRCETPCLPKPWLEKTRILSDVIDSIFFKGYKSDYNMLSENDRHLISDNYINIDRIKDELTVLMKEFSDDKRFIVSFLLSTLLNNIGKKKDGYTLFRMQNTRKALLIIDLAMFIYAYCPSFDQTRKIISMLTYMNDEVGFRKVNTPNNESLQKVIRRYSFIFEQGNLPDLCDWLLFFYEYNISLTTKTEKIWIDKAKENNNPITWANLLIYAQYYPPFFDEMKGIITGVVKAQIERMTNGQWFEQVEFWYAIIFHNCPHISMSVCGMISQMIDEILRNINMTHPNGVATKLVCDFLQQQSSNGNKPLESFFNWDDKISVTEQIKYRTYQRTIFKRYRRNKYDLYASIE